MSNGSGSADYYVGPPAYMAPAPGTKEAPQVTSAAQAPASTPTPGTTHNYFVGPPVNPEKKTPPQPATPPPPSRKNGSGFLARCFPCMCGTTRVSEQ